MPYESAKYCFINNPDDQFMYGIQRKSEGQDRVNERKIACDEKTGCKIYTLN